MLVPGLAFSLLSSCFHLCAAAFQHDRRIRIYETANDWRLRKDVHARNLRWTVTDTCLSPDQKYLLYSSITPTVHMVSSYYSMHCRMFEEFGRACLLLRSEAADLVLGAAL